MEGDILIFEKVLKQVKFEQGLDEVNDEILVFKNVIWNDVCI